MIIKHIKTIFAWWGSNLYKGLPRPVKRLFCSSMPRLGLRLTPNQQLSVIWTQEGRQQEAGSYELESTFDFQRVLKKHTRRRKYALELVLTEQQALHLQHTFPEAVKDNLKQVVSYQLDRLTPFTVDAVYFDAQVAQHDKARKEILADIYLAPVNLINRLQEQLSVVGVPALDLVSAKEGKVILTKGLTPPALSPSRGSLIPLYVFLMALSVALVAPIIYKQRRVEQLDAAWNLVKSKATNQLELRDKLLAAEDALRFLQERRKTSAVTLDVVEQLSATLPQHTWLERLEITGSEVQIRGESGMALSLIDTLEGSAHFAQVSFKSPVTRNNTSGKDKFHIQAQVEAKHE